DRRPRRARRPRRPRGWSDDDPLPGRRRRGDGRERRADADAARADRRGARPRRGARGARSDAADPRGRLPRADRVGGGAGRGRRGGRDAGRPGGGGGPMNGVALVGHQFRYEQKAFWRNPAAVFFTVMFPVIVFLILALVFSGDTVDVRGGVKASTY